MLWKSAATFLDLLALSWFITEAVFFIASRKADRCRKETNVIW